MSETEALRAALEPFARLADAILAEAPADANHAVLWTNCEGVSHTVTLDQLRAVSSALTTPAPDRPAEERAREVLDATPHSAGCPWNMSEWDKAAFTSNELMEMQCDCDQIIRAMLALASECEAAAGRAERERCACLAEDFFASAIATAIRGSDDA